MGGSSRLTDRLTELSRACWERGRALPPLAMKKLFERAGEAYDEWNRSLPGYEPPDPLVAQPFASPDDLRRLKRAAEQKRAELHREMVALQEEMDWLVYVSYGLADDSITSLADEAPPEPLDKEQRPFALLIQADGDHDGAVALIPADWSAARKALWTKRLEAIRDNEHIRRIEQPAYKRRWYHPKSYDAEFADAFEWWIREKAEWWLEHKKGGGPVELGVWTQALWDDDRVQAAWPIAVEAYARLAAESEQRRQAKKRKGAAEPGPHLKGLEPSPEEFARRFKDIIEEETVPAGIPAAVAYDELEKRKISVPGAVKRIRGKLNVPRERFRKLTPRGPYLWAGLDLFENDAK